SVLLLHVRDCSYVARQLQAFSALIRFTLFYSPSLLSSRSSTGLSPQPDYAGTQGDGAARSPFKAIAFSDIAEDRLGLVLLQADQHSFEIGSSQRPSINLDLAPS